MLFTAVLDDEHGSMRSLSDEEAFELLYREHSPSLYQIAKSRVSEADASDIVQSAFLGLWKRRHGLPLDDTRAYLRGAVRHGIIDTLRALAVRRNQVDVESRSASDEVCDPDQSFESAEACEQALRALNGRTRLTVLLFHADHFTRRQIAAILNISVRTVKHDLAAVHPLRSRVA